jgi:hypothetical protein
MDLFTEIADAQVILRSSGVYKQAKLFARGDDLYAGAAGGYVMLRASGITSKPTIAWLGINVRDDGYLPGTRAPKKAML